MNKLRLLAEALFDIIDIEIKSIFKDKGVMVFLFLVPLAYPIIYTLIYNTEIVKDVPIVVVDKNNSFISREYIRRLDAHELTKVVGVTSDAEFAKKMMHNRDCFGYIIMDEDFTKNVYDEYKSAEVNLVCDLASVFYYKAYMLSATEIALDMGREFQKSKNSDNSRIITKAKVRPIESVSSVLYNPTGGYASFLIPAVLILILQQSTLIAICMMVGTAREQRERPYLLNLKKYGKKFHFMVIFGRSFVFFVILFISSLWTLVIIPRLFELPQMVDPSSLFVFLIPFLLSVIFFANTIALFVRSRETPIIFIVFTSVIFLFLMGIGWPWHAMPSFWKMIAVLIPSTPAGRGFVAISSMGCDIKSVMGEYINLWILTFVYLMTNIIGRMIIYRKEV